MKSNQKRNTHAKQEPLALSAEDLRRLCRFESSLAQLKKGRESAKVTILENYQITPEDLKTAVINFRKSGMSEEEFGTQYFAVLWDELYEAIGLPNALAVMTRNDPEPTSPPNAYTVLWTAWDILVGKYEYDEEDASLDDIVTEVQTWEENRDKPFSEREYTRAQKKDFLGFWIDARLESADEDVKAAYRKILDGLCAQDDINALRTKAYACYGYGNAAYGQDWQVSMECLLRLMERDPNPQTANTLGYMYYYGRCSDGVPDYDKAFYYFSIGAAGHYYESRYKLSDMYRHGYGVPKMPNVAAGIIWELYDEQLDKIMDGIFRSNFADVALRAGNLWKDGVNCWANAEDAFYYYLQARYAIRMRMMKEDNYGDRKVAAGIEQAIAEVLPKTRYQKPRKTVHFQSVDYLLRSSLHKAYRIEMKIQKKSDTEAKLVFRPAPTEIEGYPCGILVTVPSAHYCELLKKVTVKAKKIKVFDIPEGTDTIYFDAVDHSSFYLYGEKVAEIEADYVFTVPNGDRGRFSVT